MFFTGISSRIDTRFTVQGIHFQTCIISKTTHPKMVNYILCFLQCIAFQCISRFGNIGMTVDVLKRENIYFISQDGTNLT